MNCIDSKAYFVGNNTKERIARLRLQENKACQIFQKTNISYQLICTRIFKFGVFCFLVTSVLRFYFLPY